MWKILFSPECLFGLALTQALVPYVIWWSGLDSAPEAINFTYIPAALWVIAYLSFCAGTAMIRFSRFANNRAPYPRYNVAPFQHKVDVTIWTLAGVILIQLVAVTALYGTMPLISFIQNDGRLTVTDVNSLQEMSGLGQIGLLAMCNILFNGALLLRLLCHLDRGQRLPATTLLLLLLSVVSTSYAGKRQGVLITAVYIVCGFSLYYGSPIVGISRLLRIPKERRAIILFLGVLGVIGFISGIGYLSTARNQGARGRTGAQETLAYLQYPLLNLERQTQDTGFGPLAFDPFYPVIPLVPYKLQDPLAPYLISPPVKPIPSSPSSFFERLQWGWGPAGIALFCFVTGAITTLLYINTTRSLSALLVYCICAYALLSAYAYNHFLNLVFLPIPSLIFFLCGRLFQRDMKSVRSPSGAVLFHRQNVRPSWPGAARR